jgi:MSHA biogenesis protein MshO
MRRKPLPLRRKANANAGFTLVELIMVIAITGIIAGVVAVFLRAPVQGYFDSARRAELTDIADTALRRISRDLHLALPNSVRVSGTAVEFLQTGTGGRYAAESDGSGASDILDFNTTDSSFDVLGDLSSAPVNGDLVVVYNLGIGGANAYAGDNTAIVATGSTAGHIVLISPGMKFPYESPANRFQIVSGPVSYVCSGAGVDANGNGTGVLSRYWGYGISSTQSVPPGGSFAPLATGVSACSFVYQAGVTARSGLVSIQLQLSEAGETVSLYHEVHVPNVP